MNIQLIEIEKKKNELFFNVIDRDINTQIGILFTIDNHIAYEIYPEFRGQGAATDALKIITKKINKPVLEISIDNIASKKVALKAGYTLVKKTASFEFYGYSDDDTKIR